MEPTDNIESFNADELEAPEWLNAEFFEEVLSKYEKNSELKVLDVKTSPASGKGDHYASVMFRANVEYTTPKGNNSKSLIIKTMPQKEGHKMEFLRDSYIFETEIGMYTKALPKFEEILRKVGDETRLCVPCIYHSLEPRQVIIFDDLVPQGYIVKRGRFGNIEEIKAAYTKLAKMQAVSFHILQKDPEFLKDFKHGVSDMPNFKTDPFMTSGMSNFLELLNECPELSEYKPYFEKIKDNYMENFGKVIDEYRQNRQPNGYYVLCHGDYHFRNMMFKYNKEIGNLEDCMLVDFQISNICPITMDLIYSIYMLMGPEERRNYYKELIDFYFFVFLETLKKIGFKGELPNLVEFWKQMKQHKFYEIFVILTILPMVFGISSKEIELADLLSKNEVRKKLYFLDEYIAEIKYLLARFKKLGYFD